MNGRGGIYLCFGDVFMLLLYIYIWLYLIAEQYFIVWVKHSLFFHSVIDGHLDCFQFSVIINNVAMNNCVQVSVWTYIFITLG